jgi:hypothetical protein
MLIATRSKIRYLFKWQYRVFRPGLDQLKANARSPKVLYKDIRNRTFWVEHGHGGG